MPRTSRSMNPAPRGNGAPLTLIEKLDYLGRHPGFRAAPASVLFRLLLWKSYCALGISGSIRLPPSHARMVVPPQWRGMSKVAFTFRERYERELALLASVLSPGDVFADVGACYGIYTLMAASLVGEMGRVLAFEPSGEAFRILRRNIALNGFSNVLDRRVALADRPGIHPFYVYSNPSRNSFRGDASADACQCVETSTLDHELARAGLLRLDVIKIDTEGAEGLVLRGARQALAEFHPLVILEINPAAASRLGLESDGAWRLLRRHGYSFLGLDAKGFLRTRGLPTKLGPVIAIYRHT